MIIDTILRSTRNAMFGVFVTSLYFYILLDDVVFTAFTSISFAVIVLNSLAILYIPKDGGDDQ